MPAFRGERFRKVRSGAATLWLGPDIELLPDGTLLKQVGELGRIAGTLGSGGVREWLHRDGLASNRLMTDAAGIHVQHSHYLPYGDRSGPLTVDENGGPAAPESIGYIGERGDPDTNRYAYAGNDRNRHRSGKRFIWFESGQLFTGDTEDDQDVASTV